MNKNFLLAWSLITALSVQITLFAEFPNDLCPSIPGSDPDNDHLVVEKLYPGAQFWFNAMIKKYPQARLDKMRFCVSDAYEAGPGIIYFPEYQLKSMNQVFAGAHVSGVTDEMFAQFAEDEYLLLHEAKHVLCKDVQHADTVIKTATAATAALALVLLFAAVKDKISFTTQMSGSVFGIGVAYASLCAYARFQESRADNFANQNSDARALRAGAYWFKRLNTLMNFENISVPDVFNSISKIIQDPTHPAPENRADKALQALAVRFAKTA